MRVDDVASIICRRGGPWLKVATERALRSAANDAAPGLQQAVEATRAGLAGVAGTLGRAGVAGGAGAGRREAPQGRGGIENNHSTEVESTNRVRASVALHEHSP